jgi:hypothetical protein
MANPFCHVGGSKELGKGLWRAILKPGLEDE